MSTNESPNRETRGAAPLGPVGSLDDELTRIERTYPRSAGAAGLDERTLEVLAAAARLDPVNESVRIVAGLANAEYARLVEQTND